MQFSLCPHGSGTGIWHPLIHLQLLSTRTKVIEFLQVKIVLICSTGIPQGMQHLLGCQPLLHFGALRLHSKAFLTKGRRHKHCLPAMKKMPLTKINLFLSLGATFCWICTFSNWGKWIRYETGAKSNSVFRYQLLILSFLTKRKIKLKIIILWAFTFLVLWPLPCPCFKLDSYVN
jgi:hypothetical protein